MHATRRQYIARPFMFATLALAAMAAAHAGDAPVAPPPAAHRDGQHDFDFHIGRWKTQLRRLAEPLSGSTAWLEYEAPPSCAKCSAGAPTWSSWWRRARTATSRA